MSLRTIFIFGIIGMAAFGAYGMANTLISDGIHERQSLQIVSSHPESLVIVDLDKKATITKVKLTFTAKITATVTVDIHALDGTLIGTGTAVVNNRDKTTINLSDIVTEVERPDLRKVTVTGV